MATLNVRLDDKLKLPAAETYSVRRNVMLAYLKPAGMRGFRFLASIDGCTFLTTTGWVKCRCRCLTTTIMLIVTCTICRIGGIHPGVITWQPPFQRRASRRSGSCTSLTARFNDELTDSAVCFREPPPTVSGTENPGLPKRLFSPEICAFQHTEEMNVRSVCV